MRKDCEIMRSNEATDSQYVLVRLCDLEELLDMWEKAHNEKSEHGN